MVQDHSRSCLVLRRTGLLHDHSTSVVRKNRGGSVRGRCCRRYVEPPVMLLYRGKGCYSCFSVARRRQSSSVRRLDHGQQPRDPGIEWGQRLTGCGIKWSSDGHVIATNVVARSSHAALRGGNFGHPGLHRLRQLQLQIGQPHDLVPDLGPRQTELAAEIFHLDTQFVEDRSSERQVRSVRGEMRV